MGLTVNIAGDTAPIRIQQADEIMENPAEKILEIGAVIVYNISIFARAQLLYVTAPLFLYGKGGAYETVGNQ